MKILFVGDHKDGFIVQDLKILREDNEVEDIDMNEYPLSLKGGIRYLKKCFANPLYKFDLAWVWFADVHAIPILLAAKLFHKPVIVCVGLLLTLTPLGRVVL